VHLRAPDSPMTVMLDRWLKCILARNPISLHWTNTSPNRKSRWSFRVWQE